MARSRDSLLGQGGQRRKMGRSQLRGRAGADGKGGTRDPLAEKQEILRKLREKSERETAERETAEPETSGPEE